MPTPFDDLNSETLKAKIGERTPEGYELNRSLVVYDDNWRNGAGWVGPGNLLMPGVKDKVNKQFTPRNTTATCVDRVVAGLTKNEAQLSLTPALPPGVEDDPQDEETEAEQQAKEYLAAISAWWDRNRFHERAREAERESIISGRGLLRFFVPSGKLEAGTAEGTANLPRASTLEEALELIAVEAPPADRATIITDEDTQEKAGVLIGVRDGKPWHELYTVDGDVTVFRYQEEGTEAPVEARWRMGGRLPLVEMEAPLMVTETIRRNQAALNFAHTTPIRLGETAAFPERYIGNSEPTGIWLTTPPVEATALRTERVEGVTWYLHPMQRTLGAATINELTGLLTTDENGRVTRANPTVHRFEPADPAGNLDIADYYRQTIVEDMQQAHTLRSGDGQRSGVSLQQARADYETSLHIRRGPLETLQREGLLSLLAMCEWIEGKEEGFYTDNFHLAIDIVVDAGPPLPEQQDANVRQVEAGLLSRVTAMSRNGVEDPSAEIALIDADPAGEIAMRERRAQLFLSMTQVLAVYPAALAAGYSEQEAREMARTDYAVQDPEDADTDADPDVRTANEGDEEEV